MTSTHSLIQIPRELMGFKGLRAARSLMCFKLGILRKMAAWQESDSAFPIPQKRKVPQHDRARNLSPEHDGTSMYSMRAYAGP